MGLEKEKASHLVPGTLLRWKTLPILWESTGTTAPETAGDGTTNRATEELLALGIVPDLPRSTSATDEVPVDPERFVD